MPFHLKITDKDLASDSNDGWHMTLIATCIATSFTTLLSFPSLLPLFLSMVTTSHHRRPDHELSFCRELSP